MKIDATVVGGAEVIARFERMPDKLRAELAAGIGRAVLRLQREVKENKLDGQVLHRISSRLERSINAKVTESQDAVEGTVGTNVEYARVHEFGFQGTETVREHLRRSVNGKSFTVRSHARQVNIPEKSFLRSALRDMQPQIRAEFEAAVNRAVR